MNENLNEIKYINTKKYTNRDLKTLLLRTKSYCSVNSCDVI